MKMDKMKRKSTRAVLAGVERSGTGLFADNGGDGGGAGGDDPKTDGGGGDPKTGGDDRLAKLEAAIAERDQEIARLREHADGVLTQRKKDRDRLDQLARKAGDFESIENSYKEKLADKDQSIASLTQIVENTFAGRAATELAAAVAMKGSEKLVRQWIAPRIRTEFQGADKEPKTVVLDANGNPSAMTLDELKEELLNDPALAPVVVGSKAKGAGGPDPESAGGSGKTIKASELEKMTPREKAHFFEKNPDVTVTD